MPCPYIIIFGRETALPSPLYHSGAAGIDINRCCARNQQNLGFLANIRSRNGTFLHPRTPLPQLKIPTLAVR